jgi:hypothetical protein
MLSAIRLQCEYPMQQDVSPCSLVVICQDFRRNCKLNTYCRRNMFYFKDGESVLILNVGKLRKVRAAWPPRTQRFPSNPPWEIYISEYIYVAYVICLQKTETEYCASFESSFLIKVYDVQKVSTKLSFFFFCEFANILTSNTGCKLHYKT